jgi:DNA-binding MarR family transcriptional regulator
VTDADSLAPQSLAHTAETLSALVGKLRRKLRERSTLGDLTPSQVAALLRLEREGPLTSAKLAQSEGMRPQSMSAVVSALTAQGFIEAQPDPNDRRQMILSLTEACREQMKLNRVKRRNWLVEAIQSKLNAAEQKQLAAGVELLKRLVDEDEGRA